jgi:hypothetical protein
MKKTTKNSWINPKLLKIVSQEIQKSPDNLSNAFKSISEKTGVSLSSITQAWYKKLRYQLPQFVTGSGKNAVVNGKNTVKRDNTLLQEKITHTQVFDGIKVVTVKKYYIN